MMGISGQEKMREEILKRKLEGFEHLQFNYDDQSGMSLLLNHRMHDNFAHTQKVGKDVVAALDEFEITFPPDFRFSRAENLENEVAFIWPRANRTRTFISYDCRHLELKLPCGEKALLWSFHLAARRQEGDVGYYFLSFPAQAREDVERFMNKLHHFARESKTQGKVIRVHGGTDIRIRGKHRWEDMVLSDPIRRAVKDDLEFWMASESRYREKRIPYRRGYLFEGPPGNGKTTAARIILSLYDFAAFSFNFSNIHLDDNDLQNAFETAANSAPAVFLLENIDRIFSDGVHVSRITKEGLLNCLDGIATYSGLVVVATANHPESLDPAIRHRPGRFDVPVHFPNPAYPQRLEFLRRLLGNADEHAVPLGVVESAAAACEGMSMAFLKLIYEIAASKTFKMQTRIISADALLEGLRQAKGYYDQTEAACDRNAGFMSEDRKQNRTALSRETTDAGSGPPGPKVCKTTASVIDADPTSATVPTRHTDTSRES